MLELRPNCEHCNKNLLPNSTDAMICSFECTYCYSCAIEIFKNVCPSCQGNFVPRPIRTQKALIKYPASTKYVFKPKDLQAARKLSKKLSHVKPEKR